MPYKDEQIQKAYKAAHFQRNKARYTKANNKRRALRRIQFKQILVTEAGGKCEICGYSKCIWALVFHHKDPTQKEFSIGKHNGEPLEKLRNEAKKCSLLCSNCHAEAHAGIR